MKAWPLSFDTTIYLTRVRRISTERRKKLPERRGKNNSFPALLWYAHFSSLVFLCLDLNYWIRCYPVNRCYGNN